MQRRRHLTTSVPRDRAFWVAVSVLVLGQLVAFWMVCSQQVRMAQVRRANARVEALAVADCMRHVPNASLASCMQRVAPPDQQAVATAGQLAPESPEPPVNSVYH